MKGSKVQAAAASDQQWIEQMAAVAHELRSLEQGRKVGLFSKRREYPPMLPIVFAFNRAQEAIWQWSDGRRDAPAPAEVLELCEAAKASFERVYAQESKNPNLSRGDRAVFAENTNILAGLLEAAGDLEGAARWGARTLEFETTAEGIAETRAWLARVEEALRGLPRR